MPESPQLSLAVGDRVVYPKQGLCRVAGMETKEVAGQKLVFVTMRREEDGAVMYVPQGKIQSIGIRKLAAREEIAKIFSFLAENPENADLDWKQRKVANLDRMTQGGLQGLAEVVKGLQVLSEVRPLPTKERELYDTARHLLVTELAAALGGSDCDSEDAVDLALFPPGRERPKRTAADFKAPSAGGDGEDSDGLEAADDLLGLAGELDLPEEPAAEDADGEVDEAPAKARLSDDDITVTQTATATSRSRAAKAVEAKAKPPPKAKPAAKPAAKVAKPAKPPKEAKVAKPAKAAKPVAKPASKPAAKGKKK